MKESYPIEVAEYTVAQRHIEEPAFAWWVTQFLKKPNRIIVAVKRRYHKQDHKFGI